ncbi:MAG: type 2 isopentenyl-diphosphate Delta-isomerase [Candidatus Bathyarchaeia archaeon]|jgi:isopentenyl-diphosphate delta-isomerase
MSIGKRKQRHIRISLEENVESDIPTGLNDVNLVHRALPEIDLKDVDTSIELFGRKLSAPIIISAITGGTEYAERINCTLAKVAQKTGIGIGVGSQRIAIQQPEVERTFRVVRDNAPNSLVIGNLGCPQLSLGWGFDEAKKVVDMIEADALAIHMNPLQEAVQVGGETNYRGILKKIASLTSSLRVPVIMKETGAGISYEDARRLENAGVSGFEISGLGGTSWAAVEHHIAKEVDDTLQEYLGKSLWNWGIPTACSLVEVRAASKGKIIASGGLRTGLDIAKALSLGADAVGIAKPFLQKAIEGEDALEKHVETIITEVKTCMFLIGAQNVAEMKSVPVVVSGWTAEWLRARGFNTDHLAIRGR